MVRRSCKRGIFEQNVRGGVVVDWERLRVLIATVLYAISTLLLSWPTK